MLRVSCKTVRFTHIFDFLRVLLLFNEQFAIVYLKQVDNSSRRRRSFRDSDAVLRLMLSVGETGTSGTITNKTQCTERTVYLKTCYTVIIYDNKRNTKVTDN